MAQKSIFIRSHNLGVSASLTLAFTNIDDRHDWADARFGSKGYYWFEGQLKPITALTREYESGGLPVSETAGNTYPARVNPAIALFIEDIKESKDLKPFHDPTIPVWTFPFRSLELASYWVLTYVNHQFILQRDTTEAAQ